MTQLQKWMLWLLRQSHRWDRLGFRILGQKRYQALKNLGWKIYIRQSIHPKDKTQHEKPQ